jgi:hypothetical protein
MSQSKRQPNFSAEELEAMVTGVETNSKLLFGKFGGVVTSAAKEKCWISVAEMVTAVGGVKRTAGDMKKKWCQMKRLVLN